MDRVPIFYGGGKCGELTVCRQGLYLEFCAQIRLPQSGVPRIYLKGEQSEALLGVAQPAPGGYLLRRTVAARSVFGLGAIRCGYVKVSQAEDGEWKPLRPGALSICRPFCCKLPETANVMQKAAVGVTQFAYPYEEKRPFPLPALFCLARIEEIWGKMYVVFSFDEDGCPILR